MRCMAQIYIDSERGQHENNIQRDLVWKNCFGFNELLECDFDVSCLVCS